MLSTVLVSGDPVSGDVAQAPAGAGKKLYRERDEDLGV